jgi:hypothetical protein
MPAKNLQKNANFGGVTPPTANLSCQLGFYVLSA